MTSSRDDLLFILQCALFDERRALLRTSLPTAGDQEGFSMALAALNKASANTDDALRYVMHELGLVEAA